MRPLRGAAAAQPIGDARGVDVSVIIPTFRREKEVIQAITSALRQEGVSVEVIVLDDSPEGSARTLVEGIADARVRYTKREAPSGGRPALVRNNGVRMAKGRYVCFLDDDDQVLPGCFRSMTSALDANRAVGVAVGTVVSFGSNAEILRVNESWAKRAARLAARTSGSPRLAAAALLFSDSFTSACLIRREHVAALGGYDATIPLYEDVEFYARAIRTFGHVFVDHPMLYRRTGERSLTHDARDNGSGIRQGYAIMHHKYRRDHGAVEYTALRVLGKLLYSRWSI
jgi:glycosyltransferase involved in cell wall biosynthesis